MTITIRQLKPDEWAVLKDVRLTALLTDPRVFGSRYEEECHKDESEWRAQLSSPKVALFVLFDGNSPIGMTAISYNKDDPEQKSAILWGSWLRPEYRKRGLSDMMYKARLTWVEAQPDIKSIYVGHRASNAASRSAIQKHGFKFTHADAKTWHDGVTEDDMRYELTIRRPTP